MRYCFGGLGEYWKIIKRCECKSCTEIYFKNGLYFSNSKYDPKAAGMESGQTLVLLRSHNTKCRDHLMCSQFMAEVKETKSKDKGR